MSQAFKDYDAAVKDSSFPAQEHTFKIDEEVLDKLTKCRGIFWIKRRIIRLWKKYIQ
mgnify:CR=1 FL=1